MRETIAALHRIHKKRLGEISAERVKSCDLVSFSAHKWEFEPGCEMWRQFDGATDCGHVTQHIGAVNTQSGNDTQILNLALL